MKPNNHTASGAFQRIVLLAVLMAVQPCGRAQQSQVDSGQTLTVNSLAAESPASAPAASPTPDPTAASEPDAQVEILDTRPGKGAAASEGDTLTVHYTGWLANPAAAQMHGKKFDSSLDRHAPIKFVLGAHRVIPGWEKGLLDMREGGIRTLVIPPQLGYGAKGFAPLIPPNATLVFEVRLLSVTHE